MKRRRIVILVALAVIAGGSWWFFLPGRIGLAKQPPPGVLASGFIEAKDIAIAPEIGGRIVAISAAEGDEIRAGAVLMRLDDSLLKAQERQAEATVRLARATLDQATSALNQSTVSRDGARNVLENALDVQKNPLELEARITSARNELSTSEVALGYDSEIDRYRGVPKSTYWTVAFATQRRDNA
ncbi:MAG: biotin/lipoyl-binding protein, partial [Chloroflexi bacterium]|nr:biotin/lipoyl-binding protein [Chloroflexota bacterium]